MESCLNAGLTEKQALKIMNDIKTKSDIPRIYTPMFNVKASVTINEEEEPLELPCHTKMKAGKGDRVLFYCVEADDPESGERYFIYVAFKYLTKKEVHQRGLYDKTFKTSFEIPPDLSSSYYLSSGI